MAFVDKVNTTVNQNKDKMFEDMDVDFVETAAKKNAKNEGSEEGEVSEDDTDPIFPPPEPPSENKVSLCSFYHRIGVLKYGYIFRRTWFLYHITFTR